MLGGLTGLRKNALNVMQGVVRLCSGVGVIIQDGSTPKTDGKDKIWLPPIPDNAPAEQRLETLCVGMHEGGHITEKSDASKTQHDMLLHRLVNIVDDVRCENEQEKHYSGLKTYRQEFYPQMLNGMVGERLKQIPLSLVDTLQRAGSASIFKGRARQLGIKLDVQLHRDTQEFYDKVFADLEDEIVAQKKYADSLKLGEKLLKRVREIIKEEEENKRGVGQQQEQQQQQQQQQQQEQQKGQKQSGSGKSKSKKGNDSEENDEGEEDQKQSSSGKSESKKGSKDYDADGSEDGGDAENGSDDDSKGADAHDNSSGEDSGKEEEQDTGDSDDATGSDVDDNEDTDSRPDDDSDGSDDEDSTSGEDKSEGSEDSEDDDKDTDDGEDSSSGDDDTEEETEEERKEREEEEREEERLKQEAEEKTEEIMRDLEANAEDIETPMDEVSEDMRKKAQECDGLYMVAPWVKDDIDFEYEASSSDAQRIREEGLKILGTSGSRMTRLFVNQMRPRTLRNKREGRLDMRTLIADVHDVNRDVFSKVRPGTLEKAAVAIALDESGSMHGKKIQTACQILSGLMHHLCRAQIPVEVLGYSISWNANVGTKWREQPARLRYIKKFEESYNEHVICRCAKQFSHGNTNDLDALKLLVPRLWARKETKKILFVISDGEPQINNNVLRGKLIRSYKEYIKLCKHVGIYVFGFGIMADVSPYFEDDCVKIDESTLSTAIVEKMTEVLNRRPRFA